jgi:hypothetical protein
LFRFGFGFWRAELKWLLEGGSMVGTHNLSPTVSPHELRAGCSPSLALSLFVELGGGCCARPHGLRGVHATITKPRELNKYGNEIRPELSGSPLWFAAKAVRDGEAGALELAKLLVEEGATVDACGKWGGHESTPQISWERKERKLEGCVSLCMMRIGQLCIVNKWRVALYRLRSMGVVVCGVDPHLCVRVGFLIHVQVGVYKLNSADPQLETAWFQPLSLKCENPVSKFAFKLQLAPLRPGLRRRRATTTTATVGGAVRTLTDSP